MKKIGGKKWKKKPQKKEANAGGFGNARGSFETNLFFVGLNIK